MVLHLLEIARQPRACYDCFIPPVTMTGHAVGCVSPRIEEPMKVSKVGGPKGPDSSKKSKKSVGDDGAFAEALRGTSGTEVTESAQATSNVGAVGQILAVQQAADATDHRSRGLLMNHGNDLLDRLEQLRMSVLTGAISKDKLQELARTMRERKMQSDDPRLNDLVAEIELRVEVEIAKLTR